MVLLTPKFVFVALVASLTAVSLAPPTDAAAIAMRRGHQHHVSVSSEPRSGPSASHLNHPVLPLPARLTSASGKQTQGKSGTPSKGSVKRQSPRDFFASQRRSLTPEDLPPLLTRRDSSHHKSHQSSEHTPAQESTQEGSGPGPYAHVNAVNSHVAYSRRSPNPIPDPRHGHDHHHHGNHHDHHHGSKDSDEVVVIKGDNDNIHISGRSPLPDPRHHHHHHDHHDHHHWRSFGGSDMIPTREDNDVGRRSPDPRHEHDHHHDHHGHGHNKGHGGDKVVIKGDDNNISVHSRFRIARNQRTDHSPENAPYGGHQHHAHPRKYIPRHQPHQDGEPSTEHSKSAHRSDSDRPERHPRSVLISSVEGEEKYLVPDGYQDQSVTVIEGGGVPTMFSKAKRGDPGIEGAPGSIEIMSQSAMSEAGQRIASLVLVEPDSAISEFGNSTFILNASENNRTQLFMVSLNTTDSGVQGEDIPVALKVPVFNPESASIEGYCATYDPQPPAPAPLSVERCFYDEPTGAHKSQVFAYTPSTSVIRPMWFSGETDEEGALDDPSSNSTAMPDASVDPKTPLSSDMTSVTDVGDFGNSTGPPSSISSLDNSTGIDQGLSMTGSGNESMIPNADDFTTKAQNVTLIFSPSAPIIPAGSRTPTEDVSDLDEVPMGDSNSTKTDSSTSPLTSSASGGLNETASGFSDDTMPVASMPLPHSVPSETVSQAAAPSGLGMVDDEGKDLNVMVGVARDQSSNMKAVNTAPYEWKFDRDRS